MKTNIAAALAFLCATLLFADGVIVNDNLPDEFGKPIPFSKIAGTKGTMDLQISGGKLYALENRGLSIYDLSDKLSPKLLSSHLLTANPDMPAFWRGRLLLSCGYAGLLLEK